MSIPTGPHETWEPIEIPIRSETVPKNPYTDVTVSAVFEHESGERYEIPGFWDGGDEFAVRFAPPHEGEWSWSIKSNPADYGLKREGTIRVDPYDGSNPLKEHGHLITKKRHLAHADGTPFFWLGDTVWSASAKATPEEWQDYLEYRTEQGYSVVQLNSLPQHDAGKPHQRLPFGEEWDLDSPRPSYFRRLDGIVQSANAHGVVPAIVVLWFNYALGTNESWNERWDADFSRHPFNEEQARRWARYLSARYAAYGAVWLVSGDWDVSEDISEGPLPVYDAAGMTIHKHDPFPVCAVHMPGGQATTDSFNEREWLDIHAYQSGHHRGPPDREGAPADLAERHRSMEPPRPTLDSEPCYENMGSVEDGVRFTRAEVRTAGWQSVLGGANAGLTYGGNGIWQWYREGEHFDDVMWIDFFRWPLPWREGLAYPAAGDYVILKELITSFSFESLTPKQNVLMDSQPGVRAAEIPEDGVFLVYTPETETLRLDCQVSDAEWFHPGTRQRTSAMVDGTDPVTIEPPNWDEDALLIAHR